MKLLHLALFRISHYFQSNKLIFLLYVIGTTVCSLTFIYFYGNGNPTYRDDSSFMDRSFDIIFTKGISEEEMKSKMESFLTQPVEEYFMRKQIPRDSVMSEGITIADKINSSVNIDVYFGRNTEGNLEVGCCQNGTPMFYTAMGRIEFREGEGSRVAFLSSEFAGATSMHIDDVLTIDGNNYNIIGTTASIYANIYLPYEGFRKLDADISFCELILKNNLNFEESAQIKQAMLDAFPGAEVRAPDFFLQLREESAVANQLLSALLYLVGLVSFLFLIQYMLNRSGQEVVVMGLVGAKKRSVLLILLEENIILTVASVGLGTAVYFSLQQSIFLTFAVAPNYVYTILDLGKITLSVLMLSVLAAFPFYWRYCSKTLAKMKIRYVL